MATIKELIETRVRPAVANDGGDITFRGFKEGVVYLNMKGACSGCPSSTATLRHGIQICYGISSPTSSRCGRCRLALQRPLLPGGRGVQLWRIDCQYDCAMIGHARACH